MGESSEFCRVCGDFVDNTKPLFEGSQRKLLPKIKDLTGLQLNKIKDLPQNICKACERQIQQSHRFRERCIQAQESFALFQEDKDEAEAEEIVDTYKTKKKRKTFHKSLRLKQEDDAPPPPLEEVEVIFNEERNAFKMEETPLEEDRIVPTDGDQAEMLVQLKQEPKNTADDDANHFSDSFHFLLSGNDVEDSGSADEESNTLVVEAELSLALTDAAPAAPLTKSRKDEMKAPPPPPRRRRKPAKRVEHDFICDQCGKHFKNKQHLQTHLQRHSGIKPYPCKLCPKGYYAPGDLRRHMYKHTGEKPFHCKFCELSFNDNSHLLQHTRRQHTNERPFICDQCPKTFTSSCNFKAHATTHSGVRAYTCKLCNVSYKHRSHLNRHYRSVMHKQFLEKQAAVLSPK